MRRKHLVFSGFGCLALLGIALWLTPWLDACPLTVTMRLHAPSDSQIWLEWGDAPGERIPVVSLNAGADQAEPVWTAEAPPLPSPCFRIRFESPVQAILLREIEILGVPGRRLTPHYRYSSSDENISLNYQGLNASHSPEGVLLAGPAGSCIELPRELFVSRSWSRRFIAVFVSLVWVAILLGATLVPIVRMWVSGTGAASPIAKPVDGNHWIWLAFAGGAALQLAVTLRAPPLVNLYDSFVYFVKAVALLEGGTFRTDWDLIELDRLPGYPAFLAAVFWCSGNHLWAVYFTQTVLFCIAVLTLALSLRRWLGPTTAALALALLLLNPKSMGSNQSLMTESLFSSLVAFALTAFLAHLRPDGSADRRWLTIFAFLVLAAVFVRPNGIVLLVAPLLLWMQSLRSQFTAGADLSSRWKNISWATLRYGLTAVPVTLALLAWTERNRRLHQLAQPVALVGLNRVEGQIRSGVFDASVLQSSDLYRPYLLGKLAAGYRFTGCDLRVLIERQLRTSGTEKHEIIARMDEQLRSLGGKVQDNMPWPLRIVALIRAGDWAMRLPRELDYAGDYVYYPGTLGATTLETIRGWKEHAEIWAPLRYGRLFPLPDVDRIDRISPDLRWINAILERGYRAGFLLVSLAALIACGWFLRSGQPLPALPGLIYLANLAMIVSLLNVHARYLFCLDYLLVLQTAVGVSALAKHVAPTRAAPEQNAPQRHAA